MILARNFTITIRRILAIKTGSQRHTANIHRFSACLNKSPKDATNDDGSSEYTEPDVLLEKNTKKVELMEEIFKYVDLSKKVDTLSGAGDASNTSSKVLDNKRRRTSTFISSQNTNSNETIQTHKINPQSTADKYEAYSSENISDDALIEKPRHKEKEQFNTEKRYDQVLNNEKDNQSRDELWGKERTFGQKPRRSTNESSSQPIDRRRKPNWDNFSIERMSGDLKETSAPKLSRSRNERSFQQHERMSESTKKVLRAWDEMEVTPTPDVEEDNTDQLSTQQMPDDQDRIVIASSEKDAWDGLSAEELLGSSRVQLSEDFQVSYPSDVTDNNEFFGDPSNDPTLHRFKNRPKLEPRNTSVFLFPGQGSQFVGMGKELLQYPNVSEMYAMASEILGYDLLKLCLNGPKSELDKTVHCQPAVLVTSLAAVEKLRHENPQAIENCRAAAGFSVGEYAALVFAGAMSFEDAVHLINVRAKAMQAASEEVSGGMMTVFCGANTRLEEACMAARRYMLERLGIEQPVCHTANCLFTCCKVLAGHTEGLYFIEKVFKEFNIKRVKHLPVSGAFHTILMESAREPLRDALNHTHIQRPVIWCYSNVTGLRHSDRPPTIRRMLEKQVTNQVKWHQNVCSIFERSQGDHFPTVYECGPGNQLLTMLKLTNGKAFKQSKRVPV